MCNTVSRIWTELFPPLCVFILMRLTLSCMILNWVVLTVSLHLLFFFYCETKQTDATISGIGFNTSYRVSSCGGEITSPQTLTSPNFPAYYGTNVDCIWLVDLSENGQQVQVTFDDFQLDSDDCTQDYVRILNGRKSTSPELGRYCGSTRPNVIRSQSSYLWIHFHSDNVSGNSKGISLTVDAVTSG